MTALAYVFATLAFLIGLIAISLCIFSARISRQEAAEAEEPEPVIDLDQLAAELAMEFHAWPKAA